MISIQALLTENDLADEFVRAFGERRLPEKFFYWFPLSVRAWLALCSDGAYRNFVRSRSLMARARADLARLLPVAPLEVVSLGAGQRSEEHTSELQSQSNLVCRLLLEKKKKKDSRQQTSRYYVRRQHRLTHGG